MTNEIQNQFISFPMACVAMQALSTHYALQGFHVTTAVSKESTTVVCTIFHDDLMDIVPPAGFLFSSSARMSADGYSWTKFYFNYNS